MLIIFISYINLLNSIFDVKRHIKKREGVLPFKKNVILLKKLNSLKFIKSIKKSTYETKLI
jgi:hypothetical protein